LEKTDPRSPTSGDISVYGLESIEDSSTRIMNCLHVILLLGRVKVLGRIKAGLVSSVLVLLLFVALFGVVLNVPVVWGSGTIYIRADGSIDPPTAPISTVDNYTYTFTDNIYDQIVVERSNIIIDGDGYTVEGTAAWDSKGIYLSGVTNVTIKNAIIKSFGYGIDLYESSYSSVSGNNITTCGVYGIELSDSSSNNISGNFMTSNGGYGIMLIESSNNNIIGNNITATVVYGIYLSGSLNNFISGNNVTTNNWGIVIHSSNNSINGNNIIANNYDGIQLEYGSSNSITGNNITNSSHGIWFLDSSNNSILENNITNNDVGVIVISSENSSILRNDITNNGQGVSFSESSYNTVSGNNIVNNTSSGVHFDYGSSSNNLFRNNITENGYGVSFGSYYVWRAKFYHNNFINNTQQVRFTYYSVETQWDNDYPFGGNYWSDYNGTDFFSGFDQRQPGSDGVGDTLYYIDDYNQDQYPLMNPLGPLPHPVAVFTCTPEFPMRGETVTFNASASYDLDGSITSYEWNFDGNITTATDPIVKHVYTALGTYTINLTVTDNYGFTHSNENSITTWEESSIITVHAEPTQAMAGSNVTINGNIKPIIADANVTISYKLLVGTRALLAIVKTDSNGQYTHVWKTIDARTFEIQASWSGNGSVSPARSEIKTVSVYGSISIRPDGSVDPPTAPIQRDGHSYTLTGNISVPIVVESNDVIIDGGGYALESRWWPVWGSGNALDLSNRNNVTIKNMIIIGFDVGIYLASSSGNTISRNTIGWDYGTYVITSEYGIRMYSSSNNNISWNRILATEMWIESSSQNVIYANDMHGSVIDLYKNSDGNNLVGNNFTGYSGLFLWIWDSYGNRIYHNNFIHSYAYCSSYPPTNVWDDGYPSGGNYWTGYTGQDADGDGIGDTPYYIDVNDVDRYPLMNPWNPPSDSTSPATIHNYDDLWHTTDFTVTLNATDDISGVAETYYRINDGPIQNVSAHGYPLITTEGADNKLEYWSVDNAENEELPHIILTGIKLDKTTPAIDIPSRKPAGDVEPDQSVRVAADITDTVSQVKNATVYYSLNNGTTWEEPTPMNLNASTNLYEAIIPGQPAGTWVKYKIVAYDQAGNNATLDGTQPYCTYQVIPEFPPSLILPIFMIAALLAVIVYRRKHTSTVNRG